MQTKLANIDVYTARMQKSMYDKLFFVDKIFEPIDVVVDFGCADGTLIQGVQMYWPECKYIGYDSSEEMIAFAKKKNQNAEFYSNWNNVRCNFENGLLNLSSVVHEVYSYGAGCDIRQFWDRVFDSGFKYICIRDMAVSKNIHQDEGILHKVLSVNQEQVRDFEDVWGAIEDPKNLYHYLLKYRYVENWEREKREDYLPLSFEEFVSIVPDSYEIKFVEHYRLPFLVDRVKKDFNIVMSEPTHVKMILKKKEKK